VRAFSSIRERLAKLAESMQVASSETLHTSEEMRREVDRLLAEPSSPGGDSTMLSPEALALIAEVVELQRLAVAGVQP
jgi:hypothetical protein